MAGGRKKSVLKQVLNCCAITHKIQLISPRGELFALLCWMPSDDHSLHPHEPSPSNHRCPSKRCWRRWWSWRSTHQLPWAPGCPGRGVFSVSSRHSLPAHWDVKMLCTRDLPTLKTTAHTSSRQGLQGSCCGSKPAAHSGVPGWGPQGAAHASATLGTRDVFWICLLEPVLSSARSAVKPNLRRASPGR